MIARDGLPIPSRALTTLAALASAGHGSWTSTPAWLAEAARHGQAYWRAWQIRRDLLLLGLVETTGGAAALNRPTLDGARLLRRYRRAA